jgi:hypothetical protein
VIRFSSKRIYGRLTSSYLRGSKRYSPLYARLERVLARLEHLPGRSAHISDLRTALTSMVDYLKSVETELSYDNLGVLKDAVRKSYTVSNQEPSRSLESSLRLLKLEENITQRREILEIDKLSKYFELCEDLIRLGRQHSTRALCQHLKLERCSAYPGRKQLGSPERCFVHGEIQLVFYYKRYPKDPPPRAIGSSKSACLLCDRFIQNHGSFGVSRSHMQLFTKWTMPQSPWMSAKQIQRIRNIIRGIDSEVQSLLKQNTLYNPEIQSRANLRHEDSSSLPY